MDGGRDDVVLCLTAARSIEHEYLMYMYLHVWTALHRAYVIDTWHAKNSYSRSGKRSDKTFAVRAGAASLGLLSYQKRHDLGRNIHTRCSLHKDRRGQLTTRHMLGIDNKMDDTEMSAPSRSAYKQEWWARSNAMQILENLIRLAAATPYTIQIPCRRAVL